MTCLVDLSSGIVIDLVDGRGSAAVWTWLEAQPRWRRLRVEVVAIGPQEPSSCFRCGPLSCPRGNNPVMDDHIIYALTLGLLASMGAGRWLGLGQQWERTTLVRKIPVMR
jgi:hypothetical protein